MLSLTDQGQYGCKMEPEHDPFDIAEMSDPEVAHCVDALIRTYGAHAEHFILRSIADSATIDGKRTWIRIGRSYVSRFEPILAATTAMEIEMAARHCRGSDRLH